MPPSGLINVRSFRDKYAGLVRNQKDCGLFGTRSGWAPETQEEVGKRCQIADDLSFSNAAFVNPTLFHMLRQHREFNEATERELLVKKRANAVEFERMQRERESEQQDGHSNRFEVPVNGSNAEGAYMHIDGTESASIANGVAGNEGFADSSMLLAVDVAQDGSELDAQAMDVDATTVEDALARLASSNNQAHDGEIEDLGGDHIENAQDMSGDNDGNSAEDQNNGTSAKDGGKQYTEQAVAVPAEGEEGSVGADEESDADYTDGDLSDDNYSEAEETPASTPSKVPVMTGPIKNHEDIKLLTPQSELPRGITEDMLRRAIAASGYARSTEVEESAKRVTKRRVRIEVPAGVSELENRFRTVKEHLDESTLASLRKANRRMIPPKYRLEVNFMTNRVQPGPPSNAMRVADDEVILSVCFYNTRSSTSKMEEYLVLGSQNLTVLRDAFYCISDFLVSHRDEEIENTRDRKVSSSYFFIEKTFYNDMRSPTASDYSRVIMEWANDPERQKKNPNLRGLQSRLMDGTRFLDLSIRLKQPYTFVHQGDCEHVMVFTDLRLLGPKDDQFVESYPKQVFRTRHMRHKCRMCSAYPAQYVTKNDFHSGMSPCYFCEKCYTPFHFDADGKKLLEHDAFPYANVNLM
ncbi:hypothetical protein H4R20_001566 [Coemansia guatemalensis]|uniref:snRNA-activating protein complex subunit 3 n=2 Tax=Coemansia TaxID=4863 RepID=A0A9W8HZC6_9FUNG|nr:hypothetical protein H4R20_001566 [Coemansia guatemalensis]